MPERATRALRVLAIASSISALLACKNNEQAEGGKHSPSKPSQLSAADERGHNNAKAMVANAALCEPREGPRELAACERACKLNHSNSCANWGQLVLEQDPQKASELFDRACRGGSGIGCESKARLAVERGQSGTSELFANARNYHRVHCSQQYARSCAQLSLLYEQGLGGAADAKTAKVFHDQACQLGWSCP